MTLVSVVVCAALLWVPHVSALDAFGHACTDEKLEMFSDGWPNSFDSVVYWFGVNGEVEKATGKPSKFYDPTKPTLIWMDGYNGLYHVSTCARMISKCVPAARCEEGKEYVANPWVQKGWNFGIFYWDQFADEDCFYVAEMKVWGASSMTWKSYNVKTSKTEQHTYKGPENSVAKLCASAIQSAMPTFSGKSLLLNGFSLGGQLATACADTLFKTPEHPAKPTLLNLMEPMFTAHWKPWSASPFHPCLPMYTGVTQALNWTAEAVDRLFVKYNVPTALYKSSWLDRCCGTSGLIFDPGTQLDILGTVVRWEPFFCGEPFSWKCQHEVIVPFFFFNWGVTQMENRGPTSGNCKMPSAQCTEAEIFDLVIQRRESLTSGKNYIWMQVKGGDTWRLEDDLFRWDVSNDPPPHAPESADPPPELYASDSLDVMARSSADGGSKTSSGVMFVFGFVFVALSAILALTVLRIRISRRSSRCVVRVTMNTSDEELE